MRVLMENLGFVVLIGWVPWTGISALISWGLKIDFLPVYVMVGLIYAVGLIVFLFKF